MGGGEPPRFPADEPAVTILHVSDMQFGKHHRFADPDGGFDTLLRRLCDDLALLARDHGLRPDLVALTGDLAEWGMKREFDQVAAFGGGLRAHLGLAADRLLVIPGNHDINRKLCESYFARCAGEDEAPRPPFWPKWEPYCGLFARLYRDVDRYRFTEIEPWTLFEIPALKVVVAGLNSTIHDSHRDEDHHGFLGEPQLRWFDDRLAEYERKGWLRVGMVHHNAVRRAAADDENLTDADDLREVLGERLHVLLHGHTHQGRVEMLGPALPVISTGSAAVRRDQRPGPSPDQPGETPNQYQIVRVSRGGLWCAAREYTYERKRWIGDNRVSRHGDTWWHALDRAWPDAEATFPASAPRGRPVPEVRDPDDTDSGKIRIHLPRCDDNDLLDDVIGWCRIRGEGRLEVARVRHRGPWGDYAKVHDRERGIGLLGAHQGELTAEVLERWVADVHAPFRGRGQPVSRLVVATAAIDPALRSAAQARGVDLERMIDYQRVLDTAGYRERLSERLARDREYPTEYYLDQRVTAWSPIHGSSERVERAADWLAARLLERDGAFVLVLGQAGIGKTFLLREVARRLAGQQAITPILVELRDLERAHTIEELAATQFTRSGVPWHPRAFRRDLEEGRLALLFDGFDELALRVRSAAIPAHFERIYGAAVERARIAVTSRTEHFLSSGQVADLMTPSSAGTTPLGGMLERVQRRHVLEVHPFERDDVAAYLGRRLGAGPGAARLARLARVHDLVGLACNPRMLGFLVDIPDDQLAAAVGRSGSITSDALYRIVVHDAWLTAQAERLNPQGAAPGPNAAVLRDAATNLALQLWRDPGGSIHAEDVGAHAGGLLAQMCDGDPEWATHTARARTLLTRDDRGRIGFIHQTVLEWLVAGRVAGEITGAVHGTHLDVGRLDAFMIDLLRERLGDDVLARWAEGRLASPSTGTAAENARDVLKHLDREAAAPAVLRDQDLRGQALGGQSLRHSILEGAVLTGARLVGRDLTGASLVDAELAYADFTDACLRGADLTGANLAFARFHRADLTGALLTGARLTGASLLGALGAPALDDAVTVGAALAVPPSVEIMHARRAWGGCRVAISPDGAVLASGHGDGSLRLWDRARGQLLRILPGNSGRILSMAFSPDGTTVASGAEDGTVRLSSVADGGEHRRLSGHVGRVFGLAFAPDGATVASGAEDGTVLLWYFDHARPRARLLGHNGRVFCVAFSPDGTLLVSGGENGEIRFWSAEIGTQRRWLTGHTGRVLCVAFSPDGTVLASGGEDATVRLWNSQDDSLRRQLTGHDGRVLCVGFSPDGRTVASGGEDDTVRLWDASEGREQARLTAQGGSVLGVAFSPDGLTLASCGTEATVRLWNAPEGSERARLEGHGGSVHCVAFSPDGQIVASGGADCTVRLWSAADAAELAVFKGSGAGIWSVAFSSHNALMVIGDDETMWLWYLGTERPRERLIGHAGRIWTVAFSPNGNTLVSGGADGVVRLWDAHDGRDRGRLAGQGGRVYGVAFSPDGATLASASDDGNVRLWSAEHRTEHLRLAKHAGSALCVAFSPGGATVASGGTDATVRLWNTGTGRERSQLIGHSGSVVSVAFSPDGATLASSANDGTVRLWDVASSRCLAILCGAPGGTLAARPDGRYRIRGDVAGQFWHVIGLHRYDVGELDALIPGLRLADDEPLYTRP